MQLPPKTNDHVLNLRLRKVFRLGKSDGCLNDTLNEINALPESLPFDITSVYILREQMKVVPVVLNPKSSNYLIKYLTEIGTDLPVLVTDVMIDGADSVFVVMLVDKKDLPATLSRWSYLMKTPKIIVGSYKENEAVVAAALTSFT